jgi:hypothetical protein
MSNQHHPPRPEQRWIIHRLPDSPPLATITARSRHAAWLIGRSLFGITRKATVEPLYPTNTPPHQHQ